MCKILIIGGIKPEHNEKAWKFAKAMVKPMSRANNDGLGYSAITAEGKLFGERWLDNDTAFLTPEEEVLDNVESIFGDAVTASTKKTFEYNAYGEIEHSKAVAITMHTRYATSPKGMKNVHPFVDEGVSLIHNGIIRNEKEFDLKLSTCDSEAILISYLKHDVKTNPDNFQAAATMLRGYFACGILTNDNEGPVLDIFRANGASLHIAFIKELETYVMSTSDTDIKDVCKDLGYKVGVMYSLNVNKFIRLNAITGKEKVINTFTAGGEWSYTPNTSTYLPPKKENDSVTVFPHGSRKPGLHPAFNDYFAAGTPSIIRLTDRETQEEIMMQEKFFGGSRI